LILRHEGINDSTSASLCAGLRASPSFTTLELTVSGEEMTNQAVASFLEPLLSNQSLQCFHGKFLSYSPFEVGGLGSVLADLLSTNTVLETLGLDLLIRRRLAYRSIEGETPPNYAELVVVPIANALALNRRLKVLYLTGLERVDPVSFAALTGMLTTNLTLGRIKFHDSVDAFEEKDSIEWLLTLNRYKRR
jgi:hypothetical protein